MRLSVVIPAYNVEHTLWRCVQSVIAQAVDDMEIIIVDDGSTDSTHQLADSLSNDYPALISVVHQANRGLSVARNVGIDISRGHLITFVDADDWVREDSYPPLVAQMERHPDWDILEYPVRKSNHQSEQPLVRLSKKVYPDVTTYWFKTKAYLHCYACNKLFRRHIFFPPDGQGVRFEPGRTFEDTALMVRLLRLSLTIATSPTGCYVYELHSQGLSTTADAHAMAQLLSSHIEALHSLGTTDKRELSVAEELYYMSVVNIQITLYQMSHQAPVLPSLRVRVHLTDMRHYRLLIKKILLRLVGLKNLCKIFNLIHA